MTTKNDLAELLASVEAARIEVHPELDSELLRQIVVIEDGRVQEVGRHDELIRRSTSLYRRLYQLQFSLGVEPVSVTSQT